LGREKRERRREVMRRRNACRGAKSKFCKELSVLPTAPIDAGPRTRFPNHSKKRFFRIYCGTALKCALTFRKK
jgi:hypothetical protein